MTGPSKTSIGILETLLRLEQDRKDDAIADILNASGDELARALADLGIDAAEVASIVSESLKLPPQTSKATAPAADAAAANREQAFSNAGFKVVHGKVSTAKRREKSPPPSQASSTSQGVPMEAGFRLAANRFGNTRKPTALGEPWKRGEDVVTANRTYQAYIQVSETNESCSAISVSSGSWRWIVLDHLARLSGDGRHLRVGCSPCAARWRKRVASGRLCPGCTRRCHAGR